MALLEVKDLEVYYGVIRALKGISFEVNKGEIVTLIGANGAGKTTTLQSIIGLIPSRGGTVIYNGKDITNALPQARSPRHVAGSRRKTYLPGAYRIRKSADGRLQPQAVEC